MASTSNIPRLTLKTARALAHKVVGTARSLTRENYNSYEMYLGEMCVTIRPDLEKKDRVAVSVRNNSSLGGGTYMLFDPETLEEDFGAEDRRKAQEKRECLREWINGHGPEYCKAQIDRIWEDNR